MKPSSWDSDSALVYFASNSKHGYPFQTDMAMDPIRMDRTGIRGIRVMLNKYDGSANFDLHEIQFHVYVDLTAPVMGPVMDGGEFLCGKSYSITASWSASDPESGIAEYQYALGLSPTDPGAGYIVNWTSCGQQASASIAGSLQFGKTYYVYVKARNNSDLWSDVVASDGIRLDPTPPVMGAVVDDGEFLCDESYPITASWSASDPETGIAEYQYALGTSCADPGAGYVAGWTSCGQQTSLSIPGTMLELGKTYYLYVKARNGADTWSDVAVSDGIKVCYPTIGQAKLLPEGTRVKLVSKISTGSYWFDSYESLYCYIQESNGSAGIRTRYVAELKTPGSIATVRGKIVVVDGESMIDDITISPGGTTTVAPLGMNNLTIGGGKTVLQDAVMGWRRKCSPDGTPQRVWEPASGINNIGLLVKTTGIVTYLDPAGGFAYIDDGSCLDDGNTLGDGGSTITGLRVLLGLVVGAIKPGAVGSHLTVTGVSSITTVNGSRVAALRPRTQDDIASVDGAAICGRIIHTTAVTINQVIESPHPYLANYDQSWIATGSENATEVRLHFSLLQIQGADKLYYGPLGRAQYMMGSMNNAWWSPWMPGNKQSLRLVTDGTDNYYGFCMDKLEARMPAVGVTVTLTPGNITVVTDSDGYYAFSGLASGSYTITPTMAGAVFSPLKKVVSVTSGHLMPGVNFTTN
jgi:hypothetical protein